MPKRLIAAVALWTVACSLMVVGVTEDIPAVRAVALMVTLKACVPTFWLIGEHLVNSAVDRSVRQICGAIGYAQAEDRTTRLR